MDARQKEWIAVIAVLALLPVAAFAYSAAEAHAGTAGGGLAVGSLFSSTPHATADRCPHNATPNATAPPIATTPA